MIADSHYIYKKVSENNKDLDPVLIKSVGDHLFKSLSDWIRNPDNLILNVQGLGRFIARKSKTKINYDLILKRFYDENDNIVIDKSKKGSEQLEHNIKIYRKNLEFILSKYESYNELKKKSKQLRHGNT